MNSILNQYPPQRQGEFYENIIDCFLGEHPTLSYVVKNFGIDEARGFLLHQLQNLEGFIGVKEFMKPQQYVELSDIVIRTYSTYKLSEILYFLYSLKCGNYGKLYSDKLRAATITDALKEYAKKDRGDLIHRAERAQEVEDNRGRSEMENMTKEEREEFILSLAHIEDDSRHFHDIWVNRFHRDDTKFLEWFRNTSPTDLKYRRVAHG